MRLPTLLASLLLAGAPTTLGAILVQNGNTCTVSPGGAAAAPAAPAGKTNKREPKVKPKTSSADVLDELAYEALAREQELERELEQQDPMPPLPATTMLHAPGTPGSLERFPRPEPGSRAARNYDKVKAAARPFQPLPFRRPEGGKGGTMQGQQQQVELQPRGPEDSELEDPVVEEGPEIHELEARQRAGGGGGGAAADDTNTILDAFKKCGKDGSIVISDGTYNIRQVMNTSGLSNVDISIYGTLIWSGDNIQYWTSRSFSVTYAGRSTAWLLSGTNISMRGYGKALFNGNGQAWMDAAKGQGNMNGRPISLTIWHANNVFIDGITWRMAQFWHTFVAHSQNVTMTNLDMKSLSGNSNKAVNTDGTNTWNSKDVYIANWTVACGDDCISVKGNSTNIHVENVVCQESGCACIGSMGSNAGQADYVDNVMFKNITCHHSSNAAWIKTYPGTGHVKNVTFEDITVDDVDQPIYVTPCIYSGNGCDTSRIPITDVTWRNVKGMARYNVAVGIHCSSAAPCSNFKFENVDIKAKGGGAAKVLCSNFNTATSGLNCTGTCPANWPQQLRGNK